MEYLNKYETIKKKGGNIRHQMKQAISMNKFKIVLDLFDNGYDLYDVEIFREILESNISFHYIDYYIKKGVDFNDERFYKPVLKEERIYDLDGSDYDSDEDILYWKPNIVKKSQPIGYFICHPYVLKKMIKRGMDIKRNIYDTTWGCLKREIDRGGDCMYFIRELMKYIDKEHLENDTWWETILNNVSSKGENSTIFYAMNKCYNILSEREILLSDRCFKSSFPSRKIYDNVKQNRIGSSYRIYDGMNNIWHQQAIDITDPGLFRD